MRVLLQRVRSASVEIDGHTNGSIDSGMLVLLGIETGDQQEDIDWLVRKLVQLRIFPDDQGRMNRSIVDAEGDFLVVSQFTLFASTKKGNRPSYLLSARPEEAIPLYDSFKAQLAGQSGRKVASGEFGADMQIQLVNNGPVTLMIDSRNRV